MSKKGTGTFARLGKAVGSAALAAVVATSFAPTAALGATIGDIVYYKLPTTPIETTHKDGNTQWEYLKAWQSSPPVGVMTIDMLGIDNIGYSLPDSSNVVDGMLAANSGRYAIVLGLYGSEMNENPDEYLWNYGCYINGAKVDADKRVVGSSANVTATIGGVEYANMPPEIYYECNMLLTSSPTNAAGKTGKTYQEWIDLENVRWEEAYGKRDKKYAPVFGSIAGSGGSVFSGVANMYKNAAVADEKIEGSKDANGVYTLRTRYANGPETYKYVMDFEAISKGPQYYILSQIAAGKLKKKTVALLCGYDPKTEYYACRVLDGGNRDTTNQAGNYADNLVAIADDITVKLGPDAVAAPVYDQKTEGDIVRWYTADQIVANCDAVVIPDCNQKQRQAKAPSNGEGYTVYAMNLGGKDTDTGTKNIEALVKAQQARKAKNQSYPDILNEWPAQMAGYYSTMAFEVNLTSPVMCAFIYPEAINYTDIVAYWDKVVYHIKDAFVQETVDVTCHNASLSRNQAQLGAVSSDYVAKVSRILLDGYNYYKANYATIDKIKVGTGSDGIKEADGKTAKAFGVIQAYDMKYIDEEIKVLSAVAAPAEAAKPAAVAAKQTVIAKKSTITKTYKASKKTKKLASKKTVTLKSTFKLKAKTSMTFSKVSVSKAAKKYITVSKSGKVTVKKGLKKGTYTVKIKVSAKATSAYKSATKTITLKVKVK